MSNTKHTGVTPEWSCRICGYTVTGEHAREMGSKPPYAAMCPNCDDETLIRQKVSKATTGAMTPERARREFKDAIARACDLLWHNDEHSREVLAELVATAWNQACPMPGSALLTAAPALLAVVETVAGWPHADGEGAVVDAARAALALARGEGGEQP